MRAHCPATRELARAFNGGTGRFKGRAYIVQYKEYFGLDTSNVSIARMSKGLGTTCSREVAVSVRTPPKGPRRTGRAVLWDRSEEAGRTSRGIERVNTMMGPNDTIESFEEVFGLQWVFL